MLTLLNADSSAEGFIRKMTWAHDALSRMALDEDANDDVALMLILMRRLAVRGVSAAAVSEAACHVWTQVRVEKEQGWRAAC